MIDGWGISSEIALIWMSLDFTDDQSTLVQVMAWCRQATSHYLSQCRPSRHMASLGHNELTHWGPVTQYGNIDLGQQAITLTSVDISSDRFFGIHRRARRHPVSKLLVCIKNLKIICLKLLLHMPGPNELYMNLSQWANGKLWSNLGWCFT